MSNLIMNPIAPGPSISKAEYNNQQVSQQESASFSKYIEKKSAERDERQNMLGVKEQNRANERREPQGTTEPESTLDEAASTVADLLRQLMEKLKEAADSKEVGAGEWTFTDLDIDSLGNLAEFAGMDESELASLMMQLDENDGALGLLDFLTTLESHFAELGKIDPVTAPETNIPLLQTLLSKMGVPVEEVTRIADSSVNELGSFDLEKFLNGLKQFEASDLSSQLKAEGGLQSVELSGWEVEQLQNMLKLAGMSDHTDQRFFSEKIAQWQQVIQGSGTVSTDSPVNVDLAQLESMLAETIGDADAMRPKADVPGFLGDLEKILAQAGFKDGGASWSPVVQESITSLFQELQKMVDLAKVKVEKINETIFEDEKLLADWLGGGNKAEDLPDAVNQLIADDIIPLQNPNSESGEEITGNRPKIHSDLSTPMPTTTATTEEVRLESQIDARAASSRVRMRPEMQQLTFDQISQNVLRGLKNSQHQLTLTLYPRELGEIKVDMAVRDNQVSLSFLMENPKVKELLESNMQEFKDNMAQRGFSLQECFVSVDQENDSDMYREQFELAKQGMNERARRENFTEITELISSDMTASLAYHDGQINVMA